MPKHALGVHELLSHAPELVRGLPKKAKGLFHVARQRRNPKNGLARCIEKTAKKYPSNEAFVFEGRSLTYAEFNAQANRMARYLVDTGTQRGDVIVVAMENRPELLVAVTALAKIGAVSALINTSQRQAVLKHSVSLVKPSRVIVGAELLDAFNEVQECLPKGDRAQVMAVQALHGSCMRPAASSLKKPFCVPFYLFIFIRLSRSGLGLPVFRLSSSGTGPVPTGASAR